MIFIPEGKFQMGSDDGDSDEGPPHQVFLDGFWIDKYEVTNAQFRAFVEETQFKTEAERAGWGGVYVDGTWKKVKGANWRHPTGPDSSIEGKDNLPVVQVSLQGAAAYADWANMRLPTEAEWEKAVQGKLIPDQFGNLKEAQLPLYASLGPADQPLDAPFYQNDFGIFNMMGNVWEWLQDKYDEDYYQKKEGYNPSGPKEGWYPLQVVRGGFPSPSKGIRLTQRNQGLSLIRQSNLGFRCAVSFQTQ
jgi:formylglycine-generating enzyme required for sulfatase activity